jgi:5-methylthioadenosine/S-adenosylhomocysteine deaminase
VPGCSGQAPVFAHCNWLTEDDIRRLAGSGSGVVHNPTSNMKFAAGVCDVPALQEAGVPVALGTDGMLSNFRLDLFEVMRAAASLQRIHRGDASLLPPAHVFEMATAVGAGFLAGDTGRIEEGARADVTVIDMSGLHLQPYRRDPLNDPDLISLIVWCARPSDVRHVVCDGEMVVRDRELVRMPAGEIARRARAVDERLRPLLEATEGGHHHHD